jgi:hypothetical protein
MNKILVVLYYFDLDHLTHLGQLVDKIHNFHKYQVTLYIVTPLHDKPEQIMADKIVTNVNNPSYYVWELFTKLRDSYNQYYYGRFDYFLTERHLANFNQYCKILPSNYLPGVIPYEINTDGSFLYLVSQRDDWIPHTLFTHKDKQFVSFTNSYQGGILLNQYHLYKVLGDRSIRQVIRSDNIMKIYRLNIFTKVVCLSDWRASLIHHFTNRYSSGWVDPVITTATNPPIFPDSTNQIGISETMMMEKIQKLLTGIG